MLAWRDVDEAGESAADGYNVVVHEFAHVIDMRGGVTPDSTRSTPRASAAAGCTPWPTSTSGSPSRVDAGDETFLDPYARRGARGVLRRRRRGVLRRAEAELEAEQPRSYELLQEFFSRIRSAAASEQQHRTPRKGPQGPFLHWRRR